MKIIKPASLLLMSICMNSAFALESLLEDELSQAIGQDGITVSVDLPASGLKAQYVSIGDTTGIPSTIKPGYEFFRGDMLVRNVGVRICSEAVIDGACTSTGFSPGFVLTADATGDADGVGGTIDPLVNITFGLTGSAKKFRFYIDKIALRNGSGANEVTFLDFVHSDGTGDYFDIVPVGAGTLFTLQLGNESPSSHMINFNNANFGTINFGTLVLRDKTDTVNGGACAACNMSFGFKLDNVNFTGVGVDIADEGLVFSAATLASPMDVTFSNITVGSTITGTNTATDMGTVGIKGLQVTNFSLTIAGKS
jgi:hypothetical protein